MQGAGGLISFQITETKGAIIPLAELHPAIFAEVAAVTPAVSAPRAMPLAALLQLQSLPRPRRLNLRVPKSPRVMQRSGADLGD